MTLEVLVATMHQTNFDKIKEMNLQSDAVFANQCDRNEVSVANENGHSYTMVSTNTRGVGLNRNIALTYSKADIVLFADDDVEYYPGYAKIITDAFEANDKADIMVFELDVFKNGEKESTITNSGKRLHRYNALSYGTCVLAARRSSLLKGNIHFNELFGGGCIYSHGEDSCFTLDCFRAGLKVYGCQKMIGKTNKDSSTCFTGYHEEFFYGKGAWIEAAFGISKWFMFVYLLVRFEKYSEISFIDRMRAMRNGMKGFKDLQSYKEYYQSRALGRKMS